MTSKEGAGVFFARFLYPQISSPHPVLGVGMRFFSLTSERRGDKISAIWRVGLHPVCTCRLHTLGRVRPGFSPDDSSGTVSFFCLSPKVRKCACAKSCALVSGWFTPTVMASLERAPAQAGAPPALSLQSLLSQPATASSVRHPTPQTDVRGRASCALLRPVVAFVSLRGLRAE